ncbi:hypothetical protein RHSIM_Rhsim01G0256600 [Rhododendron simsii]|uniref:Uncharacterized protein n=1 Tax=Rhododendron simsii TaxID=118357 RepID=A0A834HMG5_RHOSS|nr:hypothetical protein RHSIM_Rhsim01G0256600 [Rhododendron simsii]
MPYDHKLSITGDNKGRLNHQSSSDTPSSGLFSVGLVSSFMSTSGALELVEGGEIAEVTAMATEDVFVVVSTSLTTDTSAMEGLGDDVKQQPSKQGNDLVNDCDNEPMGSEEDAAAAEVKAKNAGRSQNEKLYDAVGILNTKLMTAEKKRQKKANKSSGDAMEDDDKVDYVKKGSANDDDEENEEAGGSNQIRFEVLA